MNWLKLFEDVANQHPIIFIFIAFIITLVPKIIEVIFKTQRMQVDTSVDIIERISQRINVLNARCETLENELDDWKKKYYEVKEELTKLHLENQKLMQALRDD